MSCNKGKDMLERGMVILTGMVILIQCSLYGATQAIDEDSLSHTRFCLSIDGGGVRGVIPAVILTEIEKKTNRSICDLFQSGLTGTSTGGLIALGLAARKSTDPNDANYNKPLFTAEELVNFYSGESQNIFPTEETSCCYSCWVSFLCCLCCKGICSAEYDNEYLQQRLKEIFGERKLSDSLVPVQVVAFDLTRNAPVYFSTLDTPNVLMKDAALATTAAPTFFPAHSFKEGIVSYTCVDGGVFENNPVSAALQQAISFYDKKYKTLINYYDFILVSLGTGHSSVSLDIAGLSDAGKLKWAPNVVEIAITGTSTAADKHMRDLYTARKVNDNYFRLQVSIPESNSKLDDSRKSNLDTLVAAADRFIVENKLAPLVTRLKEQAIPASTRILVEQSDFEDIEIDGSDSEGDLYSVLSN